MKQVKTFRSTSPEETFAVGRQLAQIIPAPSIVAFFGDLGAGKTTLIKSFTSERTGLSPEVISSPTFQILHIYEIKNKPLYHFDLWRIGNVEEFIALGFDEYLDQKHDVCIEWSERIEEIVPPSAYRIHIHALSEYERLIEMR